MDDELLLRFMGISFPMFQPSFARSSGGLPATLAAEIVRAPSG
jgi:hypothetical protein